VTAKPAHTRRPLLVDLHCDWLLQYATETTLFDPALYGGVNGRLPQAEGYLTGTSASVLACFRRSDDWAGQPDPWSALGDLITRIEAEFPGRVLAEPADAARWLDDPEGLCWAAIGVEGFDRLVREESDLERLPGLFRRGVRLFQPVYTRENALGGSSEPGDDRGLTDLGRAFLQALCDVSPERVGPRPVVDLAHLGPAAVSAVLTWFEADAGRASRVLPVYSHGAVRHAGFSSPRALEPGSLARLRALGGVVGFSVGPPFYDSHDALRASIAAAAEVPFLGRAGYEGLAVGTDFLGVDRTLAGLGNVEAVVNWLNAAFEPEAAAALIEGNARRLLLRAAGVPPD
jgi:membrane dipeptidase